MADTSDLLREARRRVEARRQAVAENMGGQPETLAQAVEEADEYEGVGRMLLSGTDLIYDDTEAQMVEASQSMTVMVIEQGQLTPRVVASVLSSALVHGLLIGIEYARLLDRAGDVHEAPLDE